MHQQDIATRWLPHRIGLSCVALLKSRTSITPLQHSLLESYMVHFPQGRMLCPSFLQRSCARAVAQDFWIAMKLSSNGFQGIEHRTSSYLLSKLLAVILYSLLHSDSIAAVSAAGPGSSCFALVRPPVLDLPAGNSSQASVLQQPQISLSTL